MHLLNRTTRRQHVTGAGFEDEQVLVHVDSPLFFRSAEDGQLQELTINKSEDAIAPVYRPNHLLQLEQKDSRHIICSRLR